MKSLLHLIVVIIAAGMLVQCAPEKSNKSTAELVINTWKLKEFTPADRFPMPDSVRQEIIEKTVLELTSDGTFTQSGIGRTHTGTYFVTADGQRITYDHDQREEPFTEEILEISAKRMRVVDQNGNRMVRVAAGN